MQSHDIAGIGQISMLPFSLLHTPFRVKYKNSPRTDRLIHKEFYCYTSVKSANPYGARRRVLIEIGYLLNMSNFLHIFPAVLNMVVEGSQMTAWVEDVGEDFFDVNYFFSFFCNHAGISSCKIISSSVV